MNVFKGDNKLKVELLHNTPLWVAARGIRKCWASEGKSDTEDELINLLHAESGDEMSYSITHCGTKDKELIERIGNKYKHASTLEHLYYNFDIDGISRACLQELARHRIASLSVKSTRYTLKELKDEECFTNLDYYGNAKSSPESEDNSWYKKEVVKRAEQYLVLTNEIYTDKNSIEALENLRGALFVGIPNDKAKYSIPESYKTSLAWSINARSLQNFLKLRTSKAALWEIRELANKIFEALPEDHKYLFEDSIKESTDITISKEDYDNLVEIKGMYEGLCD
jgi:thymidylate synthase (FAD)